MLSSPTLYVIEHAGTVVVSTDYHLAKGLGRALAWITDSPVQIHYGHKPIKTLRPADYPLAEFFNRRAPLKTRKFPPKTTI